MPSEEFQGFFLRRSSVTSPSGGALVSCESKRHNRPKRHGDAPLTCVCVSVHTCRCVLWLCVSSGVHTNTHTHDEVFTVLLCSSAGLHSQNVAPPAAFPLLSIWGKKLKEKKKRTTDFVLKVCLFFRTCLLSLSPRAAQMNPSGEPEIQG